MITLSYGYKKPQAMDKGNTLWSALEGNIQRLNDHTHDGVNSAKLPAQNFQTTIQVIPFASWDPTGLPLGFYKQSVSIPIGFTFDDFIISFRDSEGIIYPTIVRTSNTTYDIYTIDNTQDFIAVYGV